MNGPATGRAALLCCLLVYLSLVFTAWPLTAAPAEKAYRSAIARQEKQLLGFLRAFEKLQEQLHPAQFPQLQTDLSQTVGEMFVRLRSELNTLKPPPERQDFHRTWLEAVGRLDTAYGLFVRSDPSGFIGAFRQSRAAFTRARYLLYAIRLDTPILHPYWVLPETVAHLPRLEERVPAQQHPVGISHHPRSSNHGSYSLYVPEQYDPHHHWPLIIALHGAGGANDEYLLTWLRPAKSKGYMVLAPKSLGPTWAIDKPEPDVVSVTSTLMAVRERYAVDPDRILVTGLSDGGTFSYALGARRPHLFGAVAPVAGVLPPWLDMQKAVALPFLIIHGGQDFIFPVAVARLAHATLVENGLTEVTFTELPEWGHAYTYSINETYILPWFERLFE